MTETERRVALAQKIIRGAKKFDKSGVRTYGAGLQKVWRHRRTFIASTHCAFQYMFGRENHEVC